MAARDEDRKATDTAGNTATRGHALSKKPSPRSTPEDQGPRTRGGWTPAGTAIARREISGRRSTRRGERTRQQIIDAARRVFERDGYLDVGVPDIVKEAGVAHGTFYTYFESKLEVLHEICDGVAESIWISVQSHIDDGTELDPVDSLQRLNRRYLHSYRENARLFALIDQLAEVDPVLLDLGIVRRRNHVELITATIRGWQELGVADPEIDPPTTAEVLVSAITNTAHWLYAMPGYSPPSEGAAVDAINEVWIRAVDLRRRPRRKWLAARDSQ